MCGGDGEFGLLLLFGFLDLVEFVGGEEERRQEVEGREEKGRVKWRRYDDQKNVCIRKASGGGDVYFGLE